MGIMVDFGCCEIHWSRGNASSLPLHRFGGGIMQLKVNDFVILSIIGSYAAVVNRHENRPK